MKSPMKTAWGKESPVTQSTTPLNASRFAPRKDKSKKVLEK